MNNRTHTTHLSALCLALCAGVVLLSACAKDDLAGLPTYSKEQITPRAQLPSLDIEQEPYATPEAAQGQGKTRPQTRAAADATQAMTFHFVRSDETGIGTNTFGAYSATLLNATRAAGTGTQALTFAVPQYYITNNAKSRFTGWWPAATSFTGGVVSWTLDGSQDILTAAAQEGNIALPLPAFAFEHKFAKLNFEVVAFNAAAVAEWGTISAVNVLAQPTTCTYTLATDAATGAVATSGSTTYAVKNFIAAALPTTATVRGDALFVPAQATNVALSLTVVSSTRGTIAVTVPARTYEAGKHYLLRLRFDAWPEIGVTVSDWKNSPGSGTEKPGSPESPALGSLRDGGVVIWVDPNDATHYKVVALRNAPTTLQHASSQGYLSGGTGEGLNNMSVVKAYEASRGNGQSGNLSVDYPAFGYCNELTDGGVQPGTWYLPAHGELQPGPEVIANVINPALQTAGGEAFISAEYWSSVQNGGWTVGGHVVNVLTGGSHGGATKNTPKLVRCMRELPASVSLSERGLANSYMVHRANTRYSFLARVKGNCVHSDGTRLPLIVGASAALLWQDGQQVIEPASVMLAKGRIEFRTAAGFDPAAGGNAVIALYSGANATGDILWSWHIWATDYNPDAIAANITTVTPNTAWPYFSAKGQVHTYGTHFTTANPGKVIMDRNLGATSALYELAQNVDQNFPTHGLIYQWGRKDPFPGTAKGATGSQDITRPTYNAAGAVTNYPLKVQGPVALEEAIKKPHTIYFKSTAPNDWNATPDNALWNAMGDLKTAYDPCPPGWRVPPRYTWSDLGQNGAPMRSPFTKNPGWSSPNAALAGGLYTGSGLKAWYPAPGYRAQETGNAGNTNGGGYFWTRTVEGNDIYCFRYGPDIIVHDSKHPRANGFSVRCVKE